MAPVSGLTLTLVLTLAHFGAVHGTSCMALWENIRSCMLLLSQPLFAVVFGTI